MTKLSKIIWGAVLIVAGVIFALNAFNITNIDVFFDGWWTLFIIVPCTVGLFSEKDKIGNIIGICIGVFLLLCCQDVLGFDMLWKLIVPAIIVAIGIKLIFGGMFGSKSIKILNQMKEDGAEIKSGSAVFSGHDMNFDGEVFRGTEINAVFGGLKCDLRGAIFEGDCAIDASAIFGGIDIIMPDNVNIKVNSNSIFGGVSDKKHTAHIENAPTVYINATCMFGGVDIK